MTFGELKFQDLKKIYGNFYILHGPTNNIFYYLQWNAVEPTIIEPCSLKERLTELSDKVQFGNNYASIAKCLGLNQDLQTISKTLDIEQYNTWRSK